MTRRHVCSRAEPGGSTSNIATVERKIRGNPILGFRRRPFLLPIEHAALPMSLLEPLSGMDTQPQMVRRLQLLAPHSKPCLITHGDGC